MFPGANKQESKVYIYTIISKNLELVHEKKQKVLCYNESDLF